MAVSIATEVGSTAPLAVRRLGAARTYVRGWYDLGSVFAGVMLVCALGTLVRSIWLVAARPTLVKRDDAVGVPQWVPVVRRRLTQIPGVTVPFTYLVPLLVSVLVSQVLHEAGHALAAALHRVQAHMLGFSLVVPGIPIAYVTLPDLRGYLTRREQLRIVSAGVWHNGCFLLALRLFLALNLARVLWVDAPGLRVVRSMDPALALWIPEGAIVTAVNDRNLTTMPPRERLAAWDAFLHDDLPTLQGWCVPPEMWDNASRACCSTSQPDLLCFTASDARCLEPLRVFREMQRCSGTCSGVCVKPAAHESVARLVLAHAPESQVALHGPFATVQQSIDVSVYRLTGWLRVFFLERLADWVAELWEAAIASLVLVNTSLCLLNMLPLMPLDGGAYLRLVLVEAYARQRGDVSEAYALETDLEEAEDAPWAADVHRILHIVHWLTLLLSLVALGAGVWSTFGPVL